MEIDRLLELLYKKLWIIILVTTVTTLVSAYVNLSDKTTLYKANSSLYIMTRKYNTINTDLNKYLSYDDIMVSKQMITDYKELLKSRLVIEAVRDELNIPGVSAASLVGAVSINSVSDSNILEVSAIDTNPERARDIANTLSTVFINKIKELTNEDNIGIVDLAQTPTSPIPTSRKKYILVSFMVGMLGTTVLICVLDQLNNTVRVPESIENEFGLKVLGMIPMKDIK